MGTATETRKNTKLASRITLARSSASRAARGALGPALAVAAVGYAAYGVAPWLALAVVAGAALAWGAARWIGRTGAAEQALGAYTLREKLGEGGMGIVYKASHAFLQRPAAIKLLAPGRVAEQDLRRFEREAQRTSQLTHPNTISVYDFGRTPEGSFYYVMEYVDGADLQTLVEREGPQDPARVAHLLAQLAGSLAEAHGAGLIHRDVKPANVMVCERGGAFDVVKVLDFGLLEEIGAPSAAPSADAGRIVGTPLYLSPEAITRPESLDARSDLYAVGAVGYFLLTGAPPFSGRTLAEACAHHLRSTPVRPSERLGAPIPSELESLIMSCLAKAPGERPASAAALRTALLGVAAAWTPVRAGRGASERAMVDEGLGSERSLSIEGSLAA